MSDKNTPESETKSNGVAIACYVLATIFFALAAVGYGRLHESWPPEIDGSVQKCLVIAFVLFLIPSVKEMNIAGVLSFKAKVEEAKAEVKEAKAEVREVRGEVHRMMQVHLSSVRSDNANANKVIVSLGGDQPAYEGRNLEEIVAGLMKDMSGKGDTEDSTDQEGASERQVSYETGFLDAETEVEKFERKFRRLVDVLRVALATHVDSPSNLHRMPFVLLWDVAGRVAPELRLLSEDRERVGQLFKRAFRKKDPEKLSPEEVQEGISLLHKLAEALLLTGVVEVDGYTPPSKEKVTE